MTTERRHVILLIVVLLFGTLLRLPGIGDSFYGDEGFSLLRDSAQLITDSEDRFRPVFFSLLYLWRSLGFAGEIGLRLLPLLFGIAQIPFAFAIGRRLGDRRLGLTFALLLALSPIAIEFSQELRMYSMVVLLAMVQVWLWLMIREAVNPRRETWLWAAFIGIALTGVYTHLHYWLFLAGFALTFVREREFAKRGLLALAVVLLFYLPNWPNIQRFMAVRGGEYAMHLPSALPKLAAAFTVGFNYLPLPEQGLGRAMGVTDLLANLPSAIVWVGWLALTLRGVLKLHHRGTGGAPPWLCYELLLVPILLALLASLITGKYWLQPKYLVFSLPAALLLLAQALLALENRIMQALWAGLMLSAFAIAYVHGLDSVHYGRRENWREAARVLQSRTSTTSALITTTLPRLLEYYWPAAKDHARIVGVSGITDSGDLAELLRQDLSGRRDIYYLRWDTAQNLDDPQDKIPSALDRIATRGDTIRLNPRLMILTWEEG